MNVVDKYMEWIKTLDTKYHWVIEKYEMAKPKFEELSKLYQHIVIVDGLYDDHDAVLDWCKNEFNNKTWLSFFYVKTGYDAGFHCFMFKNKEDAVRLKLTKGV